MLIENRGNSLLIAALLIVAAFVFLNQTRYRIANVHFTAYGCFGSEESDLEIFRKDHVLTALLSTKGKPTREKIITTSQLDSFITFFKDLKNIGDHTFCTTEITFIARYNLESIRKTDADCSWDGFAKLKETFFSN
ncbi:MAG: hypothetical protein ABIX01_05230 [Chitinophagaceae bacterium]